MDILFVSIKYVKRSGFSFDIGVFVRFDCHGVLEGGANGDGSSRFVEGCAPRD